MATGNCPTLSSFLVGDQCEENFAGMGMVVYAFERNQVNTALLKKSSSDDSIYEVQKSNNAGIQTFLNANHYAVKFECKRESQQVQGESQGERKGFIITANFVIEAVDENTAKIARALNMKDLAYILVENGSKKPQILYDKVQRCQIESGGLTTDTGLAATDDRQMSVSIKLGPVSHPNFFLDTTNLTKGLDGLLQQTSSSSSS